MKAKLTLLRRRQTANAAELERLRSAAADIEQRSDSLSAEIDSATEISSELETRVGDLETERSANLDAIRAAENEAATIAAEIEAEERAAESAVTAAAVEAPARRSASGGDLQRATEFQRTGRRRVERAAILVTNSGIAKPVGVGGIRDGVGLSSVSSIVDLVTVDDCTGLGSYRVAYQATAAEAVAATAGTAPSDSPATFNYVDLTPETYASLSYIDKGIRKQSPLDYEEKVLASARTALRRQLSKAIATAAPASALAEKLSLTSSAATFTFSPSFLSDLILSYGGDEDVDGGAVLFLNKADLKALAAVRGKNEYLPVYSILPDSGNPNTGIIKDNYGLSCRYCLNANVPALSAATLTTSASSFMFFGDPKNITLGLWGSADVEVSDGYKFAEGLLTVRGEVSAAADLTVKNGLVVVTAAKSG